jgi:hypothetical protein
MPRRRVRLVSGKPTKLHLKRIGRCDIALFALLLTAVFFKFGPPVRNTGLSSIALARNAGPSVPDTVTWLPVGRERALARAAKFSPTLEKI